MSDRSSLSMGGSERSLSPSRSPRPLASHSSLDTEISHLTILTPHLPGLHPGEDVDRDQVVQLLAVDSVGHRHCAVVPDWLGFRWRWGRLGFPQFLGRGGVEILPKTEAHIAVLALHRTIVGLDVATAVSPGPGSRLSVTEISEISPPPPSTLIGPDH